MTQYVSTESTTSYPTRSDLQQNGQTLPPFQACDDLDKSIAVLDEWVSNFIGRIQPYRHDALTAREVRAIPDETPPPNRSGLENRIYASSRHIGDIVRALDEMNEGLRL